LRRSEAFAEIYAELEATLGDEYSTDVLLEAAEKLIRAAQKKLPNRTKSQKRSYSNYYTKDVYTIINATPWSVCDRLHGMESEKRHLLTKQDYEIFLKFKENRGPRHG
jgi:endonuclease/exonuclease/phosphatase (EEP) superfamily protein YafD